MQTVLDFHIHSRFSRACSRDLTLSNIDLACRRKGVDVIATADFTHPEWFKEINRDLEEINSSGLYKLKASQDLKIKFILSTEISLIYKDNDKARRIHLVVQAPNIKAVAKLNKILDKGYNIRSDGRPILGMSAPNFVKLCLKIHPQFLIYPAHIWTPWFAVFGSKSGFDSMEECFHEQVEHIYAYETGLSSDPPMNWRLSALDDLTLLSNSDAHSARNIAREANIFDLNDFTYTEIYEAIKTKDLSKIKKTIEFFPEEGMYHYDGHRDCNFSTTPQETKKIKGICPVCKKPLVLGVDYRINDLADRKLGFRPKKSYDYVKLVELDKIIAQSFGIKSRTAKKVIAMYEQILNHLGSELYILLEATIDNIAQVSNPKIAEGIRRIRAGELEIEPGFDGQYGRINIFQKDKESSKQQKTLFD